MNLEMGKEKNFCFKEATFTYKQMSSYLDNRVKGLMKDITQQTSLIANFSFSTGDTVKTADGFTLSPGNAGTWRTTFTAYRPDSLRGKV